MYNIIENIINHTWITQNAPGNQTYVYVFAFILSAVLLFYFLDLIMGFIFKIINRNR